jgi:hypothetical protein
MSLDVLQFINSYLKGCECETLECIVSKQLVLVVVLLNFIRGISESKFECVVDCSDCGALWFPSVGPGN